MFLISQSKHKIFLSVTIGLLLIGGIFFFVYYQSGQGVDISKDYPAGNPEVILQELERVTQYELANGCVQTDDRGNRLFCGESKTKVDALHAQYQEALKAQFQPNPQAENSIRTFMNEPNLTLSNQGLHHPSNFTVGIMEEFPGGGGGKTTTPPEWERNVYIYNQTNVTSICQFYSYEVDARSGKVVQVQLIGALAIGSDSEIKKAECEKANPQREITYTEAEELAWAYARKNVPNLSQTKAEVSFDKGDRYVWTWEDTSYKLPEGLTSEPWQYPTIRVILDKQGRLMTYLNTTFFFYDAQ